MSGIEDGNNRIAGATDGNEIGNVGDSLKVYPTTAVVATDVPRVVRNDLSAQVITATGNSASFDALGFGCVNFFFNITAASGTTPTILIEIQTSDDGTIFATTHSTKQFTGVDTFHVQAVRISGKYYRYSYTVSGTSPSFTITTTNVLKAYLPERTATLIKYADLDMTNTGTFSSIFNASTCSNISIQAVRGADGKAATKFRVQGAIDGVKFDNLTADISISSATTAIQILPNYAFRFYRLTCTAKTAGAFPLDIYWSAGG